MAAPVDQVLEGPLVTTFIGFDLHRAQITYDAVDTDSGEVRTGRIRPANRTPCVRFSRATRTRRRLLPSRR
jgi:hypothetical protein